MKRMRYSYWMKMFTVFVISLTVLITVIYIIFALGYAENITNVSFRYAEHSLRTISKTFDDSINRHIKVLHRDTVDTLYEISEQKYDYITESFYMYEIANVLEDYLRASENAVSGICYIDSTGVIVNNGNIQKYEYNELHRNFLQKLDELNGRDFWFNHNGRIGFGKKLYFMNEMSQLEFIGYIYIIFSEDYISNFIVPMHERDIFIIVNSDDLIVSSSSDEIENKNLFEVFNKKNDNIYWKKERLRLFSSECEECNLKYAYLVNCDFLYLRIKNTIKDFFITILIFSLFVWFIVMKIYRNLSKPIDMLVNCMNAVQNGNLKVRLDYNKNNEFGYLCKELNDMIIKFDMQINEVMEMKLKAKEAELAAYESQINPHFMYNTLEMMRMMLIAGKTENVDDVIVCLGNLLHYNLSSHKEVYLSEELQSIENYFKILKLRYNEKFDYDIKVEDVCNCRILKFIIQPFVENAVKHGIGQIQSLGVISVICRKIRGSLVIIVSDNGVGMSEEKIAKIKSFVEKKEDDGKQIGIKNVIKRLQLYYGEKASVEIFSKPNKYTRIIIEVPIVFDESVGGNECIE